MRLNLRDIEEMILKTAKGSLSEVVVVSVLALDKEGSEPLVVHVVFGSDTPADPEAFLRGLLDDLPLPQYMCPRVAKSLSVTHPSADVAAKKPMSTIESQLKEIWKDVLSHGPHDREDISNESDFFQMGGTSMLLLEERLDTNQSSQDPRVIYHGDLRLPLLGLSKLEANRIFSQADSTIHSAAEVSHLKSYSNLHDTNVASTKELTRLCLPRRIPIHYVSTAGVAMFAVGHTFDEVSASSTPPPTDSGDGYSASKWASERFLERVNAAFDLPGHWIVLIENVSRNIVKDVLENNPWTPNGLSCIHQTGDIVIPLDQMKEYIERESEEPLPVIEKLTLTEWAEKAELVGLHSSLANVLKNADQIGILQMHIPKLVRKYRN
ncbi:Male sterility, NAD-binding [Penicillium occitanis (nom. inval.)]|nr:hypothetical protein PENOC_057420 [Penicillium occitanis (nom. inval.)]PCH09175.1 Male sterility, NAD-binding [Penicillium occitanis (nom. inval.)]